jgi:sulfate adenylyltransferase
MGAFKEPHGGVLKDLFLDEAAIDEAKRAALEFKSWDLNRRQLCDLELILNGAFSPLEGFNTREEYARVLEDMRLPSGLLWPIPVTLDVNAGFAETVSVGDTIALRDPEGVLLATMEIQDIWTPDKAQEAAAVFGTGDEAHPGVDALLNRRGAVYLGGRLHGVEPQHHYDFKLYRESPAELRARFRKLDWRKVVAFHTRKPMHRAEQELTSRAARDCEANLLIHPILGANGPGDPDRFTRMRCYEHLLARYPEQTTALSTLNLATRLAGPREALWHGIIRKNYGCTHLIVGRDHAAPDPVPEQASFYAPEAAQELFARHQEELGITMAPAQDMAYVEDRAQYLPKDEIPAAMEARQLSDAELRRRLDAGLEIPEWYSFPEVVAELERACPPRHRQGFAVFFTGLSGAGKSTVANALMVKLLEPQYPAHRLRRRRDRQGRRYRHLRADRALSRDPAPSPRWRGGRRRLRRSLCFDTDRGLRGARPQGQLRHGARRTDQGFYRRRRSLRAAGARGSRDRHPGFVRRAGGAPYPGQAGEPGLHPLNRACWRGRALDQTRGRQLKNQAESWAATAAVRRARSPGSDRRWPPPLTRVTSTSAEASRSVRSRDSFQGTSGSAVP